MRICTRIPWIHVYIYIYRVYRLVLSTSNVYSVALSKWIICHIQYTHHLNVYTYIHIYIYPRISYDTIKIYQKSHAIEPRLFTSYCSAKVGLPSSPCRARETPVTVILVILLYIIVYLWICGYMYISIGMCVGICLNMPKPSRTPYNWWSPLWLFCTTPYLRWCAGSARPWQVHTPSCEWQMVISINCYK